MSRWAVVVPSNRPERLAEFEENWRDVFARHDAELIVVHDEEPWAGIPDWIPRKTDMIRSWGFYLAYQTGAEFILSLDDDVKPADDDALFEAYEHVFKRGEVFSDYLSVGALTTSPKQMRGFPHRDREPAEVAIQYGGWSGILDYDAETQLAMGEIEHDYFSDAAIPVPRGVPVTTCSMNMAWRREYTPLMWQLPLLDGRYDRYGDIWSGLLQKMVLDALGKVMVVNGRAQVWHDRASDPHRNLEREAPGRTPNETIWHELSRGFYGDEDETLLGNYRIALYCFMESFPPDYADYFLDCSDKWLALFAQVPAAA